MTNFPDYIVHYSRGEPFRSLTSVSLENRPETISELDETNAWGLARFSDPDYLGQRAEVEARLRCDFIEKRGRPVLENPIYFFLGRNSRFEEHERNRGYAIRLADLSPDTVSFTYGDSMFGFVEQHRRLLGKSYENELCRRIFRLEELPEIFSDKWYPANSPLHIEAQLWVMPSEGVVKPLVLGTPSWGPQGF